MASFHSAITNSLLVNVAESKLWQFFFFFFYQSGIWFLFLLSCLADLEKAEPQGLCCCQRASSFQRQQLGGSGHRERVREEVGIWLLFAPVCSCRQRPAQTSDCESAHPAHQGLASRPEPRLPWRWVRPEPTGLGGPTGF